MNRKKSKGVTAELPLSKTSRAPSCPSALPEARQILSEPSQCAPSPPSPPLPPPPPPLPPSPPQPPTETRLCPLSLPPHFRSYEAYIEYCIAKFGPEVIPETAFDRMCAHCTAAFNMIGDIPAGDRIWNTEAPFCTVNEFFRSSTEGNCHVCHCLMAQILNGHESARMLELKTLAMAARHALFGVVGAGDEWHPGGLDDVESKESGIDALGRGDAILTLEIELNDCSSDWDRAEWQGILGITVLGSDGKKAQVVNLGIQLKDKGHANADMLPPGRGFPTALSTAGDASWNQALKWIENCRSHPLCNPVQTSSSRDRWPARLIAVGITGDVQVRICETSQPGFVEEPYLTLSHCWGKKGVPTRLLKENYATFLNGIQLSELPKTFQHAIEVTRKLNTRFIWIDSLCIIQNSPGDEDWIQESAKMHQVYRNSFLNLAAGASPDSSGGFFYQRYPLSVAPFSIPFGENRYLLNTYATEHTNVSKDGLILYTRGWVFQEQLLPRRTLIFGQNELHWECSTCEANESFPVSLERSTDLQELTIFRPDWEKLVEGKLVDSERNDTWNRVITTYFTRSLTKPSDRLVAISGLAEQLGSSWSGITYHAGLWSYRLVRELLWHSLRPCSQRITEIAPSWSWASLNQQSQPELESELRAHTDQDLVDILAEVLEAKTRPKTRTNPFGSVACGGSIRLRSPVLPARITATSDDLSIYNIELQETCDLDALILTDLNVKWDVVSDTEAEKEEAYLAPFEVRTSDGSPSVALHGLVLLKTTTHFRRAGTFFFSDHLYKASLSSGDDSDSGSDSRSVEKVDELSYFKRLRRWKRNLERLKRRGFFPDIDAWFAERVGEDPEERMNYLKKDPYVNGPPLNTNLEHRYPSRVEREYLPEISKFLKGVARVAEHNIKNGTPNPVLGVGEGNGYYTYEVV
ncbi:hypothetical protein SMACR_08253 [Sordaria macrospora]|uniref:Heterokaryon incompatibility domain-containing protein n=1 Tax=Sordaria macrospora TaxID=5147 RepID=A0A8S8ZKA7_SORMA|nr:hypothetical protein SMACR_08253 [Sordaria macrospora]WPJ64334.1 hypothetical protein SMAC4_08253 [Sordaria macrospora]